MSASHSRAADSTRVSGTACGSKVEERAPVWRAVLALLLVCQVAEKCLDQKQPQSSKARFWNERLGCL